MDSIFFGKLNIEVAAASGIEAVVKRELVRLGYEPSGANLGRIEFEGTFEDVLRANVFFAQCKPRSHSACKVQSGDFRRIV